MFTRAEYGGGQHISLAWLAADGDGGADPVAREIGGLEEHVVHQDICGIVCPNREVQRARTAELEHERPDDARAQRIVRTAVVRSEDGVSHSG
jgi:hypothetical protein